MDKKFKIITLCGSTKFEKEMVDIAKNLTLKGNLVIGPVLYFNGNDEDVLLNMNEQEMKCKLNMLGAMHKQKIDMCDEVVVIIVNGHIGEAVTTEINYAKSIHKPIKYVTINKPVILK